MTIFHQALVDDLHRQVMLLNATIETAVRQSLQLSVGVQPRLIQTDNGDITGPQVILTTTREVY